MSIFNKNKALDKHEAKIASLQLSVEELRRDLNRASNISIGFVPYLTLDSVMSGVWQGEKTVPIEAAINAILNHLGLELDKTIPEPSKVIVKKVKK